ncbi:3-hydroxy-9,10-secoandrosta-1,3,5(10)-triene-9,17-dione monooxygenase reductase subunit [Catelliglobosispora koreensis]|uniref:3-hydroxy-9,10-secoandrosta-1,3,5(10)-triene-9, 17-dione monooxygenase reductase subunit n=1 Tax=Catelliglobosispora koreensis TaxID=129052 RepID=UPI0003A0A443|nr:3-hydroxy-9,10-secoandrosta-1,3,5(10)-triene-9,17-dione monooxygenase reductase subunit [Catelliglobosispora koreensis]
MTIEPDRFRQVLGHFCTGVTVVTSVEAGVPVGFACQAFAALSLDPPLVLFCPGTKSSTWQRIERAGSFCVNVLAESQRETSRIFGTAGADKFASVTWKPSPGGLPILDGALTWIDCAIEKATEAGDHFIVVGRVLELGPIRDERPLLFYRGRYSSTVPDPVPGPPEVVDTLLSWARHTDWI